MPIFHLQGVKLYAKARGYTVQRNPGGGIKATSDADASILMFETISQTMEFLTPLPELQVKEEYHRIRRKGASRTRGGWISERRSDDDALT
jgi:hypothetical protein